MFVVAYTLDGADPATRPVTFAFNGGPGSSSVWLHLGLLGPRRVVSGDVDDPVPPPYRLTDNAETLLAHSDLVFIDPMSTGFTRAVKGGKPATYHGYQGRSGRRRRTDPAVDHPQSTGGCRRSSWPASPTEPCAPRRSPDTWPSDTAWRSTG